MTTKEQIEDLRQQVESLEATVFHVQSLVIQQPKTDLASESFWKRAFAVTGHNLAVIGVFYVVLAAMVYVAGGL